MGAILGQKVKDGYDSRTTVYCMGVAPSSAGKNHALSQLRMIASMSGCINLIGGDDLASDAALEDRMSRHPVTLFLFDEWGRKLISIKNGKNSFQEYIVTVFMKLYSSAKTVYLGKEYADNKQQRMIVQPCCCIYATATPETFTNGLSPSELQDGWLSRCMVFSSSGDVEKNRSIVSMDKTPPKWLCDKVKAWACLAIQYEPATMEAHVTPAGEKNIPVRIPKQPLIPTTPQAEQTFVQFDTYTHAYGKKMPSMAAMWNKCEENARKVALIVACGNNPERPEVSEADAEYACRLVHFLLLDFIKTIAPEIVSGPVEAKKRMVMRAIESKGNRGISKALLARETQELMKAERDKIIEDLMESCMICYFDAGTSSRPSYRYWTPENWAIYHEGREKCE
jgi:hypothetical protein